MEDRFPKSQNSSSFPFPSIPLVYLSPHLSPLTCVSCVVCVHSTPTPQCCHVAAHPVARCTQRPCDVTRRHTDVATPSRGRSQGGRAVGGEARRLFDQRAEAWPSVLFRYQVFDVAGSLGTTLPGIKHALDKEPAPSARPLAVLVAEGGK